MLRKETFIKGITILQKIFLKWTFNSKDSVQVNLWYKAFEGLEDREFMKMIETFCKTRVNAPVSPKDILSILVEEEEAKYINPDAAFNKVRLLIREYGWEFGKNDIYNNIRENRALYETVRDFELDLRQMTVNDVVTPKRFKEAYALKLKTICIKNVDDKLRIKPAEIEAKTSNFLPYEQ